MSREILNLTLLKLHLGKNTYQGHDSILESIRIPVHGKSFKYDVDEDSFYTIDFDKATADTIKYEGDKLVMDAEGELEHLDMFRPTHLDRNTGKKLELSHDFTLVKFETSDGESGHFRVQDLYSENAKNGYPIDEMVLDHMTLKMHSMASTNIEHQIAGDDIEGILVDGLDAKVFQDMITETFVE